MLSGATCGQKKRLRVLLPIASSAALRRGLLLSTSAATFRKLIPYLILTAVILLAFQDQLRNTVLLRVSGNGRSHPSEAWAIPPIYLRRSMGYFGAGLGVMMLAVLGWCSTIRSRG